MEGDEGGEQEQEEGGLGGLKIGSVYSLPVENQWENNEGDSSQDQKDLTLQQFGKVKCMKYIKIHELDLGLKGVRCLKK